MGTTRLFSDLKLNLESQLPLYVQFKNYIKDKIESEELEPGMKLPSESHFIKQLDVSRIVISQALKELAYEGLINRYRGKGTFISEPKITQGFAQRLIGFKEDSAEKGMVTKTEVLEKRILKADKDLAEALELNVGEEIIRIARLRYLVKEIDIPNHISITNLPLKLCPKLIDVDLTNQSLYSYLRDEYQLTIVKGLRIIEAIPADEHQAQLLAIKRGTPLLKLKSIGYKNDNVPVEYYESVYRGDKVQFEVEVY